MGTLTINALNRVRADLFIMSTSAVTDGVCFHQHHDTVLVKQAMFKAAQRRILYVDHSKFDTRALHALLPLTDFDVVVVDAQTPVQYVDAMTSSGVNLVIAPVEEPA